MSCFVGGRYTSSLRAFRFNKPRLELLGFLIRRRSLHGGVAFVVDAGSHSNGLPDYGLSLTFSRLHSTAVLPSERKSSLMGHATETSG